MIKSKEVVHEPADSVATTYLKTIVKNFTLQGVIDAMAKRMKMAQFTLPNYADDAAAGVGGLVAGQLYQTSGVVKVKQ